MDGKAVKPKRIGNHYIPPPARKQGNDANEATRHKERPMKTCENRGVKLCNDSSLLFKENSDKVKEKSRRSRRSKRTAKKADAENTSVIGENEVVEPKSSTAASGVTDRIINCQSDSSCDVSVVLVERSIDNPFVPLVGLENMKTRHPVDFVAADGSGEGDAMFKSLNSLHSSNQVITNISEEIENQLLSMNIFSADDQSNGSADVSGNEENGFEPPLPPFYSTKHDTTDISETVENVFIHDLHSCDQGSKNTLGDDEIQLTTNNHLNSLSKSNSSVQCNAHEPEFSSIEVESSITDRESCDDVRTSSEEPIVNCDVVSACSDNSSSLGKSDCLQKSDCKTPETTQWTETSINTQIHSVEDDDWESIYDDRGDCLLPHAASSVDPASSQVSKNNVKLTALDSKKVDDDDRPHETSSIIEIYGFSEELKTNDILTAFGNWIQRGFNLKWVDNTHALGILPTPALVEEILDSNIPLVKIRPISQGTPLSQERARTLVLPSSLRPKTCTALARRLVSGALGLKVNVTPEERAAERELLREAREKKKMVLQQRDAAWEGTFSSLESSDEKASN